MLLIYSLLMYYLPGGRREIRDYAGDTFRKDETLNSSPTASQNNFLRK